MKIKFSNNFFSLNNTIYSQKNLEEFTHDEKVDVGGFSYDVTVVPKGTVNDGDPESL